jgi:hypothetical protein
MHQFPPVFDRSQAVKSEEACGPDDVEPSQALTGGSHLQVHDVKFCVFSMLESIAAMALK